VTSANIIGKESNKVIVNPSISETNPMNVTNVIKKSGWEETLLEARKIIGISPILDSDIGEFYLDSGDLIRDTENAYKAIVEEFLQEEMKMTPDEIHELNIVKIERPRKKDSDQIYLHLEDTLSTNYLYRKMPSKK